jgi:hypothetical protein
VRRRPRDPAAAVAGAVDWMPVELLRVKLKDDGSGGTTANRGHEAEREAWLVARGVDLRTGEGQRRAATIHSQSGRFWGIPIAALDRAFARTDLEGWRRSVGSGTGDVEPPGRFRD